MQQFSHSKLGTFENCPLMYKFKYIDKLEAEKGDGIEAFMGSRVHDALEKLYKDLQHEKRLTEEELIAFFNEDWKKQFTEDIIIVKKDYTIENYRAMGEKALRTYYKRFQPFDQATTLACEKKIRFMLDETGEYELIGYIDRLDKVDDETYEIHDYKTSGTLPDQKYVDADRQLALYALAVKKEFPEAKRIRLIWHYLIFGVERESKKTDEQLEQLRTDTLALAKDILKVETFKPRMSALCSWCAFQKNCPEWSHKFKTEKLIGEAYRSEDGVKLVNRYVELSEKKGKVEAEFEQVKESLFNYAKQEGVNTIFGTDVQARIWQKECVKLPGYNDPRKEQLIKLLKLLGRYEEVSQVNTWELGKIIEERRWTPELIEQLKPFCREELVRRIYIKKRNDF